MGYSDVQNFNAVPMVYSFVSRAQKISRDDRNCTFGNRRAARGGMCSRRNGTQTRIISAISTYLTPFNLLRNDEIELFPKHQK